MTARHFIPSLLLAFAAPLLAQSPAPPAATAKKPILLVLTNHAELGNTGKRTGFFLSEAAHPYEVFQKAGYEVKLASPAGGFAPLDPKSYDLKDPANSAFWTKFGSGEEKDAGIKDTAALAGLQPTAFSAIFFAGGHGAMWDFKDNGEVKRLAAGIHDQGGAVGAVCHGPAALIGVKLGDGTELVKGKTVAVFTNDEETAVELTSVVPFSLQTEIEKAGGKVDTAANFTANAVRDGRLATGQNPASAKRAAELLIEALEKK